MNLDRLGGTLHAWGATIMVLCMLEAALGMFLLVDAIHSPNFMWRQDPRGLWATLAASVAARAAGIFVGSAVIKSAALLRQRKGPIRAVLVALVAAMQPLALLVFSYVIVSAQMGLMCTSAFWFPLAPVGLFMATWTVLAVSTGREQFEDLACEER